MAISADLVTHLGDRQHERGSDYAEAALVFFLNAAREWFDQAALVVDRLSQFPTGSRPSFKDLLKKLDKRGVHKSVRTALGGVEPFFRLLRRLRTLVVHGADEGRWVTPIGTIVFQCSDVNPPFGINCHRGTHSMLRASFAIQNHVIPLGLLAGWVVSSMFDFMEQLGKAFHEDLNCRQDDDVEFVEASTSGIYIPALKRVLKDYAALGLGAKFWIDDGE